MYRWNDPECCESDRKPRTVATTSVYLTECETKTSDILTVLGFCTLMNRRLVLIVDKIYTTELVKFESDLLFYFEYLCLKMHIF